MLNWLPVGKLVCGALAPRIATSGVSQRVSGLHLAWTDCLVHARKFSGLFDTL